MSGCCESHHGLLVRGARNSNATGGTLSFLGKLHIHISMILRDQTVVEVIIFDLQEDCLSVHILSRFQEVYHFGGDEHAIGVNKLHCNETGNEKVSADA